MRLPRWLRFHVMGPGGLLVLSGTISLAYGIGHWLGMREWVSALAGTTDVEGSGLMLGAMAYVGLYLAFVLVVPILLLAAGMMKVLTLLLQRRQEPSVNSVAAPPTQGVGRNAVG